MTQGKHGVPMHSIADLSMFIAYRLRSIGVRLSLSRGNGGVSYGTTALCASSIVLLAACAGAPSRPAGTVADGTILSRLPPGAPGSIVYAPERPLSPEEKARRYNQIDRQALQEQEDAIAAARAAAIAAAAAPRYYDYYGPAYPAYYGGYGRYPGYDGYNGWGYPRSGWSVGVGSGWGW
jgi:hypothetical protein